ncbi:hypothetical protein QRX60_38275 [Amycolatopsis mongoliensis]|uniref:Uncharacterized protein n=1 Tax=Amycolatopsis mongoliensis TaxID=715475 RepID=A0A9Y2JM56_9PSEU|nr:hypothetical protein [Amycolatopsis sp. 4-36]WIX99858.1 hypothetical protein QRX60_38275 [Amycolatopsis sp. 4-36]
MSVLPSRFVPAGLTLLAVLFAMVALVTTIPGGLSGLLLIFMSDAKTPVRVVLVTGTVVLLAVAALIAALFLDRIRLSRWDSRVLPRDEVLALIRAGLVHSLSRHDGVLEVNLKLAAAKEPALRTRRAHPRDYLAFVAAADELLAEGRKIRYDDETGEGPSSTDRRWISVEEAALLLGTGEVKTFACGGDESCGDGRKTFRGTPTGIKLTDRGWARHMAVIPEMAKTLVPLARVARARWGRPHISVDGRYER